ncbi:SMP-30/gluconolactonase/LRE family protein [Actinokineospora iranica]|uniref:Sugar lactone lactonase YvrE n=1 Tax=Actinokineospora iranica TaxID=1271860 RepID=A0A1G6WA19_9PSEU|nr:SMP-30/gluconolactonase/LRE family protein [Actinokineospora iranica]SDD62644.1 Sugar lactone lactonase YvrE [Actinokineospora iranica]
MASIKPRELDAAVCAEIVGERVGGLVWTGSELSWVDASAGLVRLGRLDSGRFRHVATLGVDGIAHAAAPTGAGWIVGGDPVHLRRDGRTTPLALPAATGLWSDPAGRLWLDAGGFRRVDLSGAVAETPGAQTFDAAWSPDTATVYRACPDGLVAHDFDLVNGTLGPQRVLLAARTRGVAVDDEGRVWAATPDGVWRVDAEGGAHAVVRLPSATPVGCCFVGGTLLIATAEGAVHECAPGVRGRPSVRCATTLPKAVTW